MHPKAQQSSRQEGFAGQQIAVLPPSWRKSANNKLIDGLLPTAAGYFPRASGHEVKREKGILDGIFLLCLEGSGFFELRSSGGQRPAGRFALKAGEIGYVPPKTPHLYQASTSQPWSLAWFHLYGQATVDAAAILGLGRRDEDQGGGVDVISDRFFVASSKSNMDQDLVLINRLCQLLRPPPQLAEIRLASALLRQWFAEQSLQADVPDYEPNLIERIEHSVTWLRANLDRPIRLADLAGQARLSVSRYSEVFTQRYGKPPIEFCTACRVGLAAELLMTSSSKISEIAQKVGYSDPLHFSRVFRRQMGCSPRRYRQEEGVRHA